MSETDNSVGTFRERSYTLGGVMLKTTENHFRDKHFAAPARCVRYDASTRQGDFACCIQVSYFDESGDEILESLPVITSVPIIFPGANGYTLTFPVNADPTNGDTMLLVFSEMSLDEWLSQGGNDVQPFDTRKCHLADAIAIPGLRDFAHVTGAATDHMQLGLESGLAIHVDANSVRIGDNDVSKLDNVPLHTPLLQALNDIKNFLTSHTHPITGVQPGSGAVTSAPATQPAPTYQPMKSPSVLVKKS